MTSNPSSRRTARRLALVTAVLATGGAGIVALLGSAGAAPEQSLSAPTSSTVFTPAPPTIDPTPIDFEKVPASTVPDDDELADQESGGWTDMSPPPTDEEPATDDDQDDSNSEPLLPAECDAVLDSGAALLVEPDPLELAEGVDSGHLTITNCSDHDVDWSAKTKPSVELDTDDATLPAGTSTLLGFTIDFEQWDAGPIAFKIKVVEPDHSQYVDITGFDPTSGEDVVPDGLDIAVNPGPGGCAEHCGAGDLRIEGDPGCANQCITEALVTASAHDNSLAVKTHTPASFDVWVGADVHDFGPPVATSGDDLRTSWTTSLPNLDYDTTYHVIVRAIDESGHQSDRIGTFHTADEPTHSVTVTVHHIEITYDGDEGANRGELSLAWGINNEVIARRGEDRIGSDTTVRFKQSAATHTVDGITSFLPTVQVVAAERDADASVEFCEVGIQLDHVGRDEKCDLKWNVASTGLISLEGAAELTPCTAFGIYDFREDAVCMLIWTTDEGDDLPRFTAVVAFEID